MPTVIRPSYATAIFLIFCAVLAVSSSPRRVGDGVEYWAMASQFSGGHRPSASRADILRLERDARTLGRGFDQSPLRFPELVGADGRQDFPHFWLYPLVNAPALIAANAIGLHPAWAFTLTNLILLGVAFAIVARHVSIAWALMILGGPLIWWVDKAHGDVFTVALLAIGCAWWRNLPAWSAVIFAAAAAQNPALMPVWALMAAVAFVITSASTSTSTSRWILIASAAIVAVPLAYYKSRLGVWSPLMGYTHPTWPSMRAMLSLLVDPNIGLVPNAPFLALAGLCTIGNAIASRIAGLRHGDQPESKPDRGRLSTLRDWMMATVACVLLLSAYAQSINMNHGATPGLNRWTLWLTPWLLLFVPVPPRMARPVRLALPRAIVPMLAALNTLWAVWFFRPSLPEVYRYPTRGAVWLMTHAPGWYSPAPEIFGERVSHREPTVLPVASDRCRKVLLVDGQWPRACVPTESSPPECRGEQRLCYATPPSIATMTATTTTNAATPATPTTPAGRTTFTMLGDASFAWTKSPHAWPGDVLPFMTTLRARIAAETARDAEFRGLGESDALLRATNGMGWTSVWVGRTSIGIYVDAPSDNASLELRVDTDYRGDVIDLDTDTPIATITVPRSGERPTSVTLPLGSAATATPPSATDGDRASQQQQLRHVLIWLHRAPR